MANSKQWRIINRLRIGSEKRYTREFRKVLNRQILPVLKSIEEFGIDRTINNIDNLIPPGPVADQYKKLYTDVSPKFARVSSNVVGKADEEWIALVSERFVEVGDPILSRIVSVTSTSREQALKLIQSELELGITEGLGIPEIARNMRKNIPSEWTKINKFRAQRIAQTEVVSASNFGSLKGAESTGLPVNKIWMAGGANIRDLHLVADGESVPIKDVFLNSGEPMEYPGDPQGSAENTINCKCAIGYETVNI